MVSGGLYSGDPLFRVENWIAREREVEGRLRSVVNEKNRMMG